MMKNIRRSIKGEKPESMHASKLSHISITPKSALTITPPKKVIRALESYSPATDQELSFEKGDFFHVIGHENDTDWYEACNPATNARGFVPVPYFQVLGKNERDSADSLTGPMDGSRRATTDADSGYSDRGGMGPPETQPQRVGSNGAIPMAPPAAAARSRGSKGGAPLYGVVLYDFAAERPDELEAKTGEDIIVIAQSNEEWFVAKPIGRLGGPGLIPVDFIEIRDMVTGEVVQDTKAAIARAGVPRVEEWKKMAAEYKNSSISLGQFDFDDPAGKMQRMSLQDNPKRITLQQQQQQQPYINNTNSTVQEAYRQSRSSQQGLLPAPVTASVDSYSYENGRYWYVLNAVMEDGRSWSLCRFYEDFYDFQIALLDEYKEEAGHTGRPRILPYMPGPVTYVTDSISAARRQSLDEYIKKLLSMDPYIAKCRLIKQLFAPRPGDVENPRYQNRQSTSSQQSSDSSREPSRQSSSANLNGHGNGYPGLSAPPPRNSGQSRLGSGTNGLQAQLQPPRMLRNDSTMSAATATSGNSQNNAFLKIKIEFKDEMIAVRLPKDVSFAQLQEKLQERLGTTEFNQIQYRDEPSGGQIVDMISDNDLNSALTRNPKLKLYVS